MSEKIAESAEPYGTTPGPWGAIETEPGQFVVSALDVDEVVCRIEEWDLAGDRADAHLIAAAPDMLAALRSAQALIEDQFRDPSAEPDGEWLDTVAREPHAAVCAAIAKAVSGL